MRRGIDDRPVTQEELDRNGHELYGRTVAPERQEELQMITAEQARALMVDKEILREVEYAIIYAAKQGDRSCDLKDVRFVADDPCGNIRKILEYRGFEVMYWGPSDTYMNITW